MKMSRFFFLEMLNPKHLLFHFCRLEAGLHDSVINWRDKYWLQVAGAAPSSRWEIATDKREVSDCLVNKGNEHPPPLWKRAGGKMWRKQGIAAEVLGGRCFERLWTEQGRGGNKRKMATKNASSLWGRTVSQRLRGRELRGNSARPSQEGHCTPWKNWWNWCRADVSVRGYFKGNKRYDRAWDTRRMNSSCRRWESKENAVISKIKW